MTHEVKPHAEEDDIERLQADLLETFEDQHYAIRRLCSAIERHGTGWCEGPMVIAVMGLGKEGMKKLATRVATLRKGEAVFIGSEDLTKDTFGKWINSKKVPEHGNGLLYDKLKTDPTAVVALETYDDDVINILLRSAFTGCLASPTEGSIDCSRSIFLMTHGSVATMRNCLQTLLQLPRNEADEVQPNDEFQTSIIKPSRATRNMTLLDRKITERINEYLFFLPYHSNRVVNTIRAHLKVLAKRTKQMYSAEFTWDREIPSLLNEKYFERELSPDNANVKHIIDRNLGNMIVEARRREILIPGCKIHLTVIPDDATTGEKKSDLCLRITSPKDAVDYVHECDM